MSISSIEEAAKHFVSGASGAVESALGAIGPIDLVKVEQIVASIIEAAPAIVKAEQSALPYIQAIVGLIQAGGRVPTEDEWAASKARLDAGSQVLQDAANEPDPNEQQAADPNAQPGGII